MPARTAFEPLVLCVHLEEVVEVGGVGGVCRCSQSMFCCRKILMIAGLISKRPSDRRSSPIDLSLATSHLGSR
eukprot:1888634-Pleurochrysis_carterae.AAC.1